MEAGKLKLRAILYWKLGIRTSDVLEKICEVFGDDTLVLRTVQLWYKRFDEGNFELEDRKRSGRPIKINNEDIVRMLTKQPSLSAQDIAEYINCGKKMVRRHLHLLEYVSKLNKWVPHELIENHKANRISACQVIERHKNDPFLDCVVTCDEKWVYYDNQSRRRS